MKIHIYSAKRLAKGVFDVQLAVYAGETAAVGNVVVRRRINGTFGFACAYTDKWCSPSIFQIVEAELGQALTEIEDTVSTYLLEES